MDPGSIEYLGLTNELGFQSVIEYEVPVYSYQDYRNELPNLGNGLVYNHSDNDFGEVNFDPITSNLPSMSSVNNNEDSFNEDYEFSDSILSYINQILVEEDVEGKGCMLQESLQHQVVQVAEKSLYEGIGEAYPSEHGLGTNNLDYLNPNPSYIFTNLENSGCYVPDTNRFVNDGGKCSNFLDDPGWAFGEIKDSDLEVMNTHPSCNNSISLGKSISMEKFEYGLVNSTAKSLEVLGQLNERQSVSRFSKLFPVDSEVILTVDTCGLANKSEELLGKYEKQRHESDGEDIKSGCHSRKHSSGDNVGITEGRCIKQAATSDDLGVRSDMFDKVLLFNARDENKFIVSLRTTLLMNASKKTDQDGHFTGSCVTKGRGKKKGGREEVVDLRTLLSNCAEAVAVNDRKTANELLKRVRQHSSPLGDGTQRLAHYVADALEARLAGTGSEIYKGLISRRTSASDVLKAYLLYLAACPFRKLSNFFANKNIAKRTVRAAKIHIIDFGILYGFQWPTFIQRQSMREGGPPKIKITGIDFPQPGFRPTERVKETGLRLENYAKEFRVPFEYRAIAKRWDCIQLEDFDIDEDEVVIVNSLYRMKSLPDETMSAESSKNNVLKLIRKLNPELFIHGVVNGSYSAPFFVTRFREALFHFSSQFDMLETIVPRDYGERVLIERDLLAREVLNVIACEGWERVERPETYKQWQARTMRIGFSQLPLDSEIRERSTIQVRTSYHKDFVIDEDHRWLLLGWKGRILFALTTWKPT